MRDPKSILITGASSGLGAALARAYAAPGRTLALTGRHQDRLDAVAGACRAADAEVVTAAIDVTHADPLARWIAEVDGRAPLDLVIANAGISAGTGDGGESAAQARAIFATNVDGVLNTIHPVLGGMTARGDGQIAVVSSLAGFFPFAGAPAYAASKAAVRLYAESLHRAHAATGVMVCAICPGFIRTPMTAVNPYPMPLLVDADQAAERIRRDLGRARTRIVFPWPLYLAVRLLAALPAPMAAAINRRLPDKPSQRA